MLGILAFILLWVRMAKFCKLTTADLPGATQNDIEQMCKASKTAFFIMLGSAIVSFLPYGFTASSPDTALILSCALGFGGLLIAAMFDLKAERIKKRYRTQAVIDATQAPESGAIRWYHVLACLIPYVGLPWGIVNLVKKRRSSGLLMTIVSGILLLLFIIFIIIGELGHN